MTPTKLLMNCYLIVSLCFYLNIVVEVLKVLLVTHALYLYIAEMAQRIHQELDRLEHMSAVTVETEGTTSSITDVLSSILETMSSVNDSMYTLTSSAAKVG